MSKLGWLGVYPAVITPFDQYDKIDYNLFKKNVAFQIKAGIKGVILGGSLGEASTLSSTELIDLLKFTKSELEIRYPL